jgi:hypothetical protein
MTGGDRYRVQLWRATSAEPDVLRWWPGWDPHGVAPRRTTQGGGRVVLGAESHDARSRMRWLGSRGVAHLFEDPEGNLWEHSSLPDAGGTPQLEELDVQEAERRYGPRAQWGPLRRSRSRARRGGIEVRVALSGDQLLEAIWIVEWPNHSEVEPLPVE